MENDSDAEEEGNATSAWTLAHIARGGADEAEIADAASTRHLINAYHAQWMARGLQLPALLSHLMEQLQMQNTTFTWKKFHNALEDERYKLKRLHFFAKHNRLLKDMAIMKKLWELDDLLYSVNDLLKHSTRVLKNMDPESLSLRTFMPPLDPQDDDYFDVEMENENVLRHDEEKLNSFQKIFCHMREILQGRAYRRAQGKFFSRIVLEDGTETLAFEEDIPIKEFVAEHSTCENFWKVWKWMTDPTSNYERIVEHLTERPLAEAPDLVENLHLRSYAGDKHGNWSGVYDSLTDVFWPYARRADWPAMAATITAERRRLRGDASFACAPPDPTDVCVVHLDVPFPYDTHYEAVAQEGVPLHLCWREVDAFECTDARHELADAAALGAKLDALLARDAPDVVRRSGCVWECVDAHVDARGTRVRHARLEEGLAKGRRVFAPAEVAGLTTLTEDSYVMVEDSYYAPSPEAPMRPRAVLDAWDDAAFGDARRVTARSFVVHREEEGGASPRYFRPHVGRTWRDCAAPEIDHIFRCQKFTDHDNFMCYALIGRTLYVVGELDDYEMTFFLEGIGGSGKSTVIKAIMPFWPPHLRAILSSNMQSQFGMSSLAHGAVAFCQEVSEELNLPQEEWQDATGGAWLNLAVKHKEPLVLKWKSQFVWAGNAFPKRWKNRQGQVSRRLAGVGLYHSVQPRDGRIVHLIKRKLGALQRKCVLAYFAFLEVHGSVDPMSQPNRLPPAFQDYYYKGRRDTDPIEGFLSEGTFVKVEEGATMLMDEFKELYGRYRLKYDMGKALRWSEDTYRTPFNERGVFVKRMGRYEHHDGQEYVNVDVIYNLTPVE